jgi:hypothetical protein
MQDVCLQQIAALGFGRRVAQPSGERSGDTRVEEVELGRSRYKRPIGPVLSEGGGAWTLRRAN